MDCFLLGMITDIGNWGSVEHNSGYYGQADSSGALEVLTVHDSKPYSLI